MIRPTDCVLVMGRRGCGKSYLAKRIQDLWPRKVIIDSLNEYEGEGQAFYSFHEFSDEMLRLKSLKQESFTLVYQFNPEDENSAEIFEEILRTCFYFGNLQIVIEEIQLYSSPHFLSKWLKNCLLIGRHQNLSLLFTTQRPGELNKTVLSQCSHIFCGQIIEGNDLRYIAGFLNQDAQKLSSIPERQFLYFNDGNVRQISNNF